MTGSKAALLRRDYTCAGSRGNVCQPLIGRDELPVAFGDQSVCPEMQSIERPEAHGLSVLRNQQLGFIHDARADVFDLEACRLVARSGQPRPSVVARRSPCCDISGVARSGIRYRPVQAPISRCRVHDKRRDRLGPGLVVEEFDERGCVEEQVHILSALSAMMLSLRLPGQPLSASRTRR